MTNWKQVENNEIFTSCNGFTTLLEKYPTFLSFLQKPGGFKWSGLAWGDLQPTYAYMNFFPPVNSVSWWQTAFERVCVLVGFSLHGKWWKNCSSALDSHFLAISPDIRRVRSLANHRSPVFRQKSLNQVYVPYMNTDRTGGPSMTCASRVQGSPPNTTRPRKWTKGNGTQKPFR